MAIGSGGARFGVGAAVSRSVGVFIAGFWNFLLPMLAPNGVGFALALAASHEPERKIL